MGRSATRVAVVLCAVLFASTTAGAQYFGRNKVHYDRLDFRLLQTEHFDIHYYAEEEAATRQAARMAERWYSRFSRLFEHTFTKRQPLVLYASHPHFVQTNLTAGSPSEGTGGFTERTKSRIAMPFAAGLGDTDHVLGHEIAHTFQIDVAKRVRQNAFSMPGWFIEGMAEYLSLGPSNAHTDMWMRDAVAYDRLPTLQQLDDPRYFPYRFGHSLWSYLGTRFGDEVIGRVLRSKQRTIIRRLEEATGLSADALTGQWHETLIARARPASAPPHRPGEIARPSRREQDHAARIHVAPALSPDGSRLMFLSERDRLSMDLFMSDVESSEGARAGARGAMRKVVSTAADPHFDSLQYIRSSGAWDPSGTRFAMTALRAGDPVLVIVDVDGRMGRQEIALPGVSEVYTPSWSPDGSRLVFSALKGGLSDLFTYSLATSELKQLTADSYADLQPAWSSSGRLIAFATDRFTTALDILRFGAMRIGLLDLDTGLVRPMLDEPDGSKQINPQWAPGDRAVLFVSDRGGVSNVYRLDMPEGELTQVTNVVTGVTGITATSPALSVATRTGAVAFSVYRDGRYEIETLSAEKASAERRIVDREALVRSGDADAAERPVEQVAPGEGRPAVAELLADASQGLPPVVDAPGVQYDDRLRLESFSQPYIGAATGNAFGGVLRTTFGVTFGDMLRDRQLQTAIRLGTDIDDLAGQVTYINRKEQWNWAVTAGYLPSHFYGARRALERGDSVVTRDTSHLRYMHQWAGASTHYNIDRSRRVEIGAGMRRTGLEWLTVSRVMNPEDNRLISRTREETPAGRPLYAGEAQVAYVHDTAVFGPTGPIVGQRVRVEVQPAFGGVSFTDVRVDARRYFMPVRPFTIAARVEHVGRYGPNAADPRLTPLVAGLQSLVRGYDLRTFAVDECGRTATACSVIDELSGGRLALVNLEVRAPLAGLFSGDIRYGRVPIEAIAFADAGFLWTRSDGRVERDRFRSVGAGARANLGGIVLEMTAARPFDRSTNGWTVSFLLRPGW
jgi:Tol biopolymer transport system component